MVEEYPYTVAETPWPYSLGNHRVRLHADRAGEAVLARIPWRRSDDDPEQKAALVYNSRGEEVTNSITLNLNRELGELLFESAHPGTYFVYYLPHEEIKASDSPLGPKGAYRKPQPSAANAWSNRYKAMSAPQLDSLPIATVIAFEARTAIDSFYPMLVAATQSEARTLYEANPEPVLLFPESRDYPIQMDNLLPLRWIQSGPRQTLQGHAMRGECYVFQIGVHHCPQSPDASVRVNIRFEDLIGPHANQIAKEAWSCINIDAVDPRGKRQQRDAHVARGKTLSLWCSIQIPLDAKPGQYSTEIFVAVNGKESPLKVELDIQKDFIQHAGEDQDWRLARIGWLNSTIGLDDSITAPYTALQRSGDTVVSLTRKIQLGDNGLPASIQVGSKELLAAPVQLLFGGRTLVGKGSKVEEENAARIVFVSKSIYGTCAITVRTTIEFDGGMGFDIKIASSTSQTLPDLALEIAYPKDAVPYAVGMGLKGGTRPQTWRWKWSQQPERWKEQGSRLDYFLWLGDVDAGLYCRLESPLESWDNEGNGNVMFSEDGDRLIFRARTGSRKLKANAPLEYSFRLLPTPVKPLDPHHWKYRYAHAYQPLPELRALGATVNNVHQGTLPNMYINYPFLNLDLLRPYVSEAHSLGMKLKIYYTMRELSTRLPELWAFRSLGDDIYRTGGTQAQGHPQLDFWMQEHLRHDYSPGWITLTPTGDIDTSLRVYSDSRLANFYLEGLRWLLETVEIDGLYLDEIGYPRSTMQRVRRVLERRLGAMIDMHANHNWWSCNCPIGYYMEHLPYIDRLWLGEAFDPDSPPDFWLIEMSGIPFGLSSDMLERPNPWRGMLFGMTDRALYSGPSPTPIWQLWDSFGIEDSEMIGWWNKDVPVKTGRQDVLATVYKKKDKTLIAIASWSSQTVNLKLKFNWAALGLDEHRTRLTAPEMGYFQHRQKFNPGQVISVSPGKGYLLVAEQEDLGQLDQQTKAI